MMKRISFLLFFSLVSGLLVGSVIAGGGGISGGATEVTQLANNAELATQVAQIKESLGHEIQMLLDDITMIENQITMITDMITNTAALPGQLVGTVTGSIKKVMGAYNQMQGILGKLSNIDEEFYNTFYSAMQAEESSWMTNYSEQYYELSKQMEKQAKQTIESLKLSADDINDSSKLLNDLAKNASTAKGRNAILQAGNEMLGFMGGELLKVRTLMLEQTKSYLDYAERQRTVDDAAIEKVRKDIGKIEMPTSKPVDFEW